MTGALTAGYRLSCCYCHLTQRSTSFPDQLPQKICFEVSVSFLPVLWNSGVQAVCNTLLLLSCVVSCDRRLSHKNLSTALLAYWYMMWYDRVWYDIWYDVIYHIISCHVMSCHVMSCHVMSCHVTSCHVMSSHVMLRHVTSRHVTSRHVMSCHVRSYNII